MLKLESSPVQLLDAYVNCPFLGERLELCGGQMKVPSTYEGHQMASARDFATTSRFAGLVADYALCRNDTDYAPRLRGVRTYQRDMGIGLVGRAADGQLFLMIGNGLGPNRFVGGRERRQEIYANTLGAYFSAVRFDGRLSLVPHVTIRGGGHASWNDHPNIVYDDERTVTNIRRRSWSADLHVDLAAGLTLTTMVGEAAVLDDNDCDGRDDHRLRGWEVKAVVRPRGVWRLGLRADVLAEEWHENGIQDRQRSITLGIAWQPRGPLGLKAEYMRKTLDSSSDPDLADDLGLLQLQIVF